MKRHSPQNESIDIVNCPIPCCIDDYPDIFDEYSDDIMNDTLPEFDIRESSHYNFL